MEEVGGCVEEVGGCVEEVGGCVEEVGGCVVVTSPVADLTIPSCLSSERLWPFQVKCSQRSLSRPSWHGRNGR